VNEIPFYLSSADAGLVPTWNKKDLSYWYALDNKLFEYLVSGIPVLATQQPEYRQIVEKYTIGVCVNPENKNAYLDGFWEILNRKDVFRTNVRKATLELNWEKESLKLLGFYKILRELK
jgi:glycosyltransferase involved in cell wall biosynthesis